MKNQNTQFPSQRPSLSAHEYTDPALTFSPLAWLKLQWFLHAGQTEVGGFGLSSPQDLLYVEDFVTIRQRTTSVTVEFEDEAVADYYDACVDSGRVPGQFSRLWIHTHPGDSPHPSLTDEETFSRVFGACDWAVMFILSRTGRTYARLHFAAGPGGQVLLPVKVDWAAWPQQIVQEDLNACALRWKSEFEQNVLAAPLFSRRFTEHRSDRTARVGTGFQQSDDWLWPGAFLDLDQLHEHYMQEEQLTAEFEAKSGLLNAVEEVQVILP